MYIFSYVQFLSMIIRIKWIQELQWHSLQTHLTSNEPPISTINVAIVTVKCLLYWDMAHSCGLITSCDGLYEQFHEYK